MTDKVIFKAIIVVLIGYMFFYFSFMAGFYSAISIGKFALLQFRIETIGECIKVCYP